MYVNQTDFRLSPWFNTYFLLLGRNVGERLAVKHGLVDARGLLDGRGNLSPLRTSDQWESLRIAVIRTGLRTLRV